MIVLAAIVAIVNALFAARSLEIALRAGDPLDTACEKDDAPFVSIVVPARNEEHQIEGCVRSLLAQDYPSFEVIVVDDSSTDDTAAIVAGIARYDARLTLVRAEPLPQGWIGKPWAISQGVVRARGQWLLFTDADTTHEVPALRVAVCNALERQVQALSFLTQQELETFAERAVLPSIIWTIAFGVGPLADVNNPKRQNAIFNGQYILFERGAYEALGGHAAVKEKIAEDLEFARLIKTDGRYRSAVVPSSLVRTRMYRSFGEIWNGFVKNFALGAQGQPLLNAAALAVIAILSPIAPVTLLMLLALGKWMLAGIVATSMLSAMLAVEFGLRRAITKSWLGFSLPLGMAVMLAIYVTSLVRHARGGVTWRGRSYR